MFKYTLISLAILVALVSSGFVFKDFSDHRQTGKTGELRTSIQRTHNVAGNLDDTFVQINPPTPPNTDISNVYDPQSSSNQPQQGPKADAGPQVSIATPEPNLPDSSPSSITYPSRKDNSIPNTRLDTAGEKNWAPNFQPQDTTGQPLPTDPSANPKDLEIQDPPKVEDKYAAYDMPSDAAASQSVQRMGEIKDELEIPDTDYVRAVEIFYDQWNPRYQAAVTEHKRFAWRIHRTEELAVEYFQIQKNLTNQMPNQERRLLFMERDRQERIMFREWQLQAYAILGKSNIIMDELRQMNIEITKQTLSANFEALYQDFQQVPHAITSLHEELDLFRLRSQNLTDQFDRSKTPQTH